MNRIVLSSYTFMSNGAQGIPDGLSDCRRCSGPQCAGCKSVPFTPAHDASACGYTVGNSTSAWAEGVCAPRHLPALFFCDVLSSFPPCLFVTF